MANDLLNKKCVPCEGGVPPVSHEDAVKYMAKIPGWELHEEANENVKKSGLGAKISKLYTFKDFIGAINFVNNIAELAESEGHHPGIQINYNKVTLELSTHAIGGLSENDFILAAKIDASK